MCELKSFLFIC